MFAQSETIVFWEKALSLFQAHEHLCESVRVCVATLQMMFSKPEKAEDLSVSSPLFNGTLPGPHDTVVRDYSNFLQEFPFDLDGSLFSPDSMSWLIGNF
jgi:hypothetical protein